MLFVASQNMQRQNVGLSLKECVTSGLAHDTRTKVLRFNQKFIKVLKCSAKFQCRPAGKIRWYWAANFYNWAAILPPSS